MNLRTPLLGAALFAASCLSFAADHAHWTYEGHTGPEHWGELDPSFKTCNTGREQSPINIMASEKSATLKSIIFGYEASIGEVINNGHTIQINLANGGTIKLGGNEYALLQFHFHTPSEEQIDGRHFPLVAHLVHKDSDGHLAVVAVLFELGQENAALKDIFAALPTDAGTAKPLSTFNTADLLPSDRSYYAFKGSLTTPPCNENVRWQVLKQPLTISAAQFAAFKAIYPLNARPVQPLNGRKVMSSS
ncbi:MAG TPA: carbonic anhydrase family protein [Rhodocyclaceae bacterium]|nr:carbonic anhydrase family protein [Rhodocyclaceae bacterium]